MPKAAAAPTARKTPPQAIVAHRKHYDLHPLGLRVDGNLSFADWSGIGTWLEALEQGIQWWVGDWMAYGEAHYGDNYVQAIDATGWQLATVLQYRDVCERVPFARRRLGLSFFHHREVVELAPEQQTAWLAKAEEEEWSVDRLHRELKQAKPGAVAAVWVLVEAKDAADAEVLLERFHLEGRKAKLSGGK